MIRPTLSDHLARWSQTDPLRRDIAASVNALADAGLKISELLAAGPLAGALATVRGYHEDGDSQKELDVIADTLLRDALRAAPVALYGSEEAETAELLDPAGTLAVAVDPLDGSSNIDANLTVGTIFSILPHTGPDALLQPGARQLAAGFLVYGPQTSLVLTVGEGTQIFVRDPASGAFLLAEAKVSVKPETAEYAINGSNERHWDFAVRCYVEDCRAGTDGPRAKDFNTRWVASMVADVYRILMRGGVYLYPGDARQGYSHGRLRLVYEANPVAFLMQQAQGAATDGVTSILDLQPTHLHQRVPLVFGSRAEVERIGRYHHDSSAMPERSPLFGRRGLLRA
ncbi:class 1 fructose-bisphosphatase [Ancylobacter amanitiformis]|uniref:Fructose-1,6-bisphosphatase class 1 n=1 Tax=Ancylobacter amanitiformis TaxID=217069 RepID=A0ABU0LRR0_9HYPH|nr:class 1 fructose-bisphosphatase [Ancylobacter amanitiformis]MDQ0511402.1 fructose-1,6-bisphosphatase I [Ancylobacter amanitiformis]